MTSGMTLILILTVNEAAKLLKQGYRYRMQCEAFYRFDRRHSELISN